MATRAHPRARRPAARAPPDRGKAPPEPTVQMPTLSATPSLTNVRQVIEELDDLRDTQTIRLLERHSPYREGSKEANVDEAIRVVKPEDAQSMAAIKNDVKRNAPVLFAVQIDWSVTPFDMSKVPPLAIFNAYTLYTTEAAREGRTWYGLRLGFFSDAVSAKQVAYYVRSDFKSVSVVPVTTLEKERATDINAERSGFAPRPTSRNPPRRRPRPFFFLHEWHVQTARRRHARPHRAGCGRRNVAALQQTRRASTAAAESSHAAAPRPAAPAARRPIPASRPPRHSPGCTCSGG